MCKRFVGAALALLLFVGWSSAQALDDHVAMGMPSPAGGEDKNDFLVKKKNFVLSYTVAVPESPHRC